MGYGIPLIPPGLIQNGVRFYSGNAVFRYLHDYFEDKVLMNWYPAILEEGFSWPPASQD
jgi:hypothetical protein